jgi:RNA polymerase sigma-70 factor, ECF subfamily
VTESIAPRQPMTMGPQSAPSGSARSLSFGDILDRELDFVWNCLYRLGIPEQDLEKETLEVFLRVKNALPELDSARRLHPWLAGFAYRVACKYRLRHHNEPDADAQESSAPVNEHAGESDERAIFGEALLQLDLQRRAMFVLHIIYGYSIPEIAESCELPLDVAHASLWLACAELIQALKRSGRQGAR